MSEDLAEGLPGRSLTLRQAAGRARLTVPDFRVAADALKGTDEDLRAAGGAGPERFDAGRIDKWLRRQFLRRRPADDAGLPSAVAVQASWDGNQWIMVAPDLDVMVTDRRLMAGQRRLARQLSEDTDGEVTFNVTYSTNHPAFEGWLRADDLRSQAERLLHRAAQERSEAIAELRRQGMTMPEIAAVLGLTAQRIQQISAQDPLRPEDGPAQAL
jgi:hypothetical protein